MYPVTFINPVNQTQQYIVGHRDPLCISMYTVTGIMPDIFLISEAYRQAVIILYTRLLPELYATMPNLNPTNVMDVVQQVPELTLECIAELEMEGIPEFDNHQINTALQNIIQYIVANFEFSMELLTIAKQIDSGTVSVRQYDDSHVVVSVA